MAFLIRSAPVVRSFLRPLLRNLKPDSLPDTMRVLVLALMVAAAAADARKLVPRRQVVQASPSGLPGGGAIARGRAPLPPMAMITPYDNVPLLVAEEGAVNFLSLYGGVLTLRILLSWFPQAQGVAILRPIFTVSAELPHPHPHPRPHLARTHNLTSPSSAPSPSPSPSPETLTLSSQPSPSPSPSSSP